MTKIYRGFFGKNCTHPIPDKLHIAFKRGYKVQDSIKFYSVYSSYKSTIASTIIINKNLDNNDTIHNNVSYKYEHVFKLLKPNKKYSIKISYFKNRTRSKIKLSDFSKELYR